MERDIGFVALVSERMWAYKTNICHSWLPLPCLHDEHFGGRFGYFLLGEQKKVTT
jgi:hypothetical protein